MQSHSTAHDGLRRCRKEGDAPFVVGKRAQTTILEIHEDKKPAGNFRAELRVQARDDLFPNSLCSSHLGTSFFGPSGLTIRQQYSPQSSTFEESAIGHLTRSFEIEKHEIIRFSKEFLKMKSPFQLKQSNTAHNKDTNSLAPKQHWTHRIKTFLHLNPPEITPTPSRAVLKYQITTLLPLYDSLVNYSDQAASSHYINYYRHLLQQESQTGEDLIPTDKLVILVNCLRHRLDAYEYAQSVASSLGLEWPTQVCQLEGRERGFSRDAELEPVFGRMKVDGPPSCWIVPANLFVVALFRTPSSSGTLEEMDARLEKLRSLSLLEGQITSTCTMRH
ncbi:hypothetical protein BJ508DRAFT_350060 [Ascobolus immersus RN42]|uniref:Uncharacterized protein n=1 Tax=Ascobolus immersus RN42 TaxID=1160509 RepID=A0A3N4I0L7_ASCIM|nr:hypothetical protein BJ508DRAFT_350060 [Ascobolus immersus RN42]